MDLNAYLTQQQEQHGLAAPLLETVRTVAEICTAISAQVRQGALSGVLGAAGSGNIQGEEQKKLDVIANRMLVDGLLRCAAVAAVASEEEDDFVPCNEAGAYLVLFDPLDGSSNIDVNISIGTIFSVLEKPSGSLKTESFLQAGRRQVAAGYVLYGPQTLLVLALGHGVAVFTLAADGSFVLTQNGVRVPEQTAEFAVNMSNRRHWEEPVRQYIDELLAGKTGVRGKDYNMRWVASMVAEVHRILMRGGVFLYPKDARDPAKAGKLRLMYEANPLSWMLEQAGGTASDLIADNMLDIEPNGLHQRVAVVLGSREEVAYLQQLQRSSVGQ